MSEFFIQEAEVEDDGYKLNFSDDDDYDNNQEQESDNFIHDETEFLDQEPSNYRQPPL